MLAFLSNMTLADWIGVIGSLLIASAYLGVTRAWLDAKGAKFHLINLTGAIFVLTSLYFRPNPGAIIIEILWALIALSALAAIVFKGKG